MRAPKSDRDRLQFGRAALTLMSVKRFNEEV